ncbi:separin protein, partial [Coemansia biformis]
MPDTSAMQWSQQSPGGSPAISSRSGLAKARAGMLGGLSLPGAPLDMRSDVDAGLQSRAYFQHAVDGKRITAAWAMAEAESATTGWAASDDALPGILPPNWVVCGLSIDQQRDVLVVTRYAHQQQPIVLCLPMRSVAEPQGDGGDGGVLEVDPEPGRSVFDDAFQRLRAIIAQSDETMKTGSACATDGEKRAWWEHRSSLDRQLGALLSSIEDEWLGGFRYVLEPTDILSVDGSADVAGALRTSIENCVVECLPKSYAAKAKSMELNVELCVLVLGVARRTICRAAAGDGIDAAAENDWLDVCSLLWDVYFYQGAAPQSDEDSLNSLGVRLGDALRDSPIA